MMMTLRVGCWLLPENLNSPSFTAEDSSKYQESPKIVRTLLECRDIASMTYGFGKSAIFKIHRS